MTNLDRITLSGVRVYGHHGVLAAERAKGQQFVADAVLWLDTRQAAASDDLSRTVSYAELAGRIAEIISGEPVALIETLAQRLATACLAYDQVQEAEIPVHKPDAPVPAPAPALLLTTPPRPPCLPPT